MAPSKYHNLAESLLATVRSGFELYSTWYQSQRQLQKRKRASFEETCDSSDSDDGLPGRRTVSLDSSSDENDNDEARCSKRRKRQKVVDDCEHRGREIVTVPSQRFPEGTLLRKHFPMEGWFNGEVTKGRWNGDRGRWMYTVQFEGRNGNEMMAEEEVDDTVLVEEHFQDPTLFSLEEFLDLWERLKPEEIEKSSTVRRANTRVDKEDADTQHNAQYGRFLPHATDVMFQLLRLKRTDVFLDVGHGIGNACLQAAYCRGCESRGIEVVKDRFIVSQDFEKGLDELALTVDRENSRLRIPGKIRLRHGDLADPSRHNWLVRANKVFVNNFNGVFAERMQPQITTDWHLDHYIAGLFASMEEESLMFTLSDLQLGPTQAEVNKWRIDNNLQPSPNASFFDVVKVELGQAGQVFSWSTSCKTPAFAYVYRRVKQDPVQRSATILCCNIHCEHSRKGTPIPAVAFNRDGKAVVGTCECKMSLRSNRRIPQIQISEFLDPSSEYKHWGR